MIKPLIQDDTFLADVGAARLAANKLHLWWLGQSGFLVQWKGRHLLLDPYLSDSLTKKYAATDKPHTRMTERVIAPERLDFIDFVTSSHNHTDHLDAETLVPLLNVNPALQLIIPEANRRFVAERLGIDAARPIGLDDADTVRVGDFQFTGVAAAHEQIDRDEASRCKYLGYVIQIGPWKIYHSGDTIRYAGMEARLKPSGIDLALLPINGRAPERRVAGNLCGREAAQLAHDIGAKLVVPCHYEMFEFNTAPPDEFVAECRRLGQRCAVLRAGERLTLDSAARAE
ncbi:MAG: MBL fold metallo-hydrolase [Verrucomicrobia bacterium]|nr:MBL fold metallo-hydrolase [Verrucomicrobiota bacterium]